MSDWTEADTQQMLDQMKATQVIQAVQTMPSGAMAPYRAIVGLAELTQAVRDLTALLAERLPRRRGD